jgi:uncharacterized protein YxeA
MKRLLITITTLLISTAAHADFAFKNNKGNYINVGENMFIDKNSITVQGQYRYANVKSNNTDYRIRINCATSEYTIVEFLEWIDTVPMTPERRMVDISCRKNNRL